MKTYRSRLIPIWCVKSLNRQFSVWVVSDDVLYSIMLISAVKSCMSLLDGMATCPYALFLRYVLFLRSMAALGVFFKGETHLIFVFLSAYKQSFLTFL